METDIKINMTETSHIIIFRFDGNIDETNADKIFSDIYKQINNSQKNKVILNLEELEYLNSKAIGYIADLYSYIEKKNGTVYISNCKNAIKDVFITVGITTIIPTVDTVEEAIKELEQ